MKERTKKRILPTLLIACSLPLIVFLSTPFDIFAGNYSEFVFSLTNYIWVCLAYFVISTTLIFFGLLFLPDKAYRPLSALFLGLAFLCFLQSNLLNSSLTTLQGDGEGSLVSKTWVVFDIIIWVVFLSLFVLLSLLKDKKGLIATTGKIIAIAIIFTQVMTPIFTAISNKEMFSSFSERMKDADNEYYHQILTNKNLTTVGTEKNIFVFCVDKLDETWVEKIYEKKPELFDNLKGFTWYQDHVSRYGHTYPAVVNMLTESIFEAENEKSRVDFLNKSYNNAESLKKLHDEGWKINIFTEKYYAFNDAYYLPDYIENKADSNGYVVKSIPLSANVLKLGLYRLLPFGMKNMIKNLNSDVFTNSIAETDKEGNLNYKVNIDEVGKWTDNSFSKVTGKGFYFIHIAGLHDAFKEKERVPSFKENMEIINKYITYLKEEGLYNDATIIITGDHGNGTPYNKTKLTDSIRTGMFIKPSGVVGDEIIVSQAQTSHSQLWTTILEQANYNNGEDLGMSIIETPEGVDQDREFTWHTYNCALVQYKYKIHGSAKDFKNWQMKDKKSFKNKEITD